MTSQTPGDAVAKFRTKALRTCSPAGTGDRQQFNNSGSDVGGWQWLYRQFARRGGGGGGGGLGGGVVGSSPLP